MEKELIQEQEQELEQEIEQEVVEKKPQKDFSKSVDEMDDEEVTAYAEANGWVPPEKFRNGKGKDARTFAKDFEENPKLAIGKNKDLARQLKATQDSLIAYIEMTNKRLEREAKEKEELLKATQVKKQKAEQEYDLDAYKQAEQEEKRIQEDVQEIKKQTQQQHHPALVAFVAENEWLNNEWDTRTVLFERRVSQYKNDPRFMALPVSERLEFIKTEVEKELPHMFKNKNQEEAPRFINSNRQQTGMKPKPTKMTLENMPKELKLQHDALIKVLPKHMHEQFTKNFIENHQS